MKRMILLRGALTILLFTIHFNAGSQPLPQYELSIQHPVLNGSTYEFDIYIKRTGAQGFRIGNSQFIMTFNSGNFTAPAISRVASSEQIGTGFFFDQVIVGNELRISLGGNHSYGSALDISPAGTGTKISTYQISNVTVPVLSPSLTWINEPSLIRTGVSEINSSDNYREITDLSGASHINGGGDFSAISGYKFNDLNGNGSWDVPETGLNGWKIVIVGPNGPDTVTTGTGSWIDGYYEFVNLTPGSYTISEIQQSGWSPTATPASPIVVTSGQTSANNNFGNFSGPIISGTKFNDMNANGFQDVEDIGLAGWEITATKIIGGATKTAFTNGSGNYVFSFQFSEAGLWQISEVLQPGWVQTSPVSPTYYTINVQSGTYAPNTNFGNHFYPSTISGTVFNDIAGDSLNNLPDVGLEGWKIVLESGGLHIDSVLSDINGAYSFDSLPTGTFVVFEELQTGWIRTLPPSPGRDTVIISTPGSALPGNDFGNFQLGSVSGLVYYDSNHNGIKDGAELGMAGFQVNLTGPAGIQSVNTLPGGGWSFGNLTPGNYIISEQVPLGYHLTEPVTLTHTFTCTSGGVFSDLKFGNSAAADTVEFRTVSYDSIALSRNKLGRQGYYIRPKADKVQFTAVFVNTFDFRADGVQITFVVPLYTNDPAYPLDITPPPTSIAFSKNNRTMTLIYPDTIRLNDSIIVSGWGKKGKVQRANYIWKMKGNTLFHPIAGDFHAEFTQNRLGYPMPNYLNLILEIYDNAGFGPEGLITGVEWNGIEALHGYVMLKNYRSFLKSLYDRSGLHSMDTRGFDVFNNNRPFAKIQKRLPPLRQNNRVFADLLALRTNIVASQLQITPPGLGELVFDDGVNALSGLTLEEIAERTDTMLSYWQDYTALDFSNLDTVLIRINEAFQGPMDTTSFVNGLALTGVRQLMDVPYLRAMPGSNPKIIQRGIHTQETVPSTYILYQNFPNPFNPTTTISFDLPDPSMVSLKIYNMLGQEVITLVDMEVLDEGTHEMDFDAASLASGVYFYRLRVDQLSGDDESSLGQTFMFTRKMLLMK